jgi:hypothetical protein
LSLNICKRLFCLHRKLYNKRHYYNSKFFKLCTLPERLLNCVAPWCTYGANGKPLMNWESNSYNIWFDFCHRKLIAYYKADYFQPIDMPLHHIGFVGPAYQGKDIVCRLIIEFSSLRDFGP